MDQAEGDLDHAKADLERGFYEWACFSSQQSAEKAVKAVFQKMGAEAWGRSVYELLLNLRERVDVDDELLGFALELDNRHPNPVPKRASVALSTAKVHKSRSREVNRLCRKNRRLL